MDKTLHEEYTHFDNKLPFIFHINLKRTPTTCNKAKNWHENIEIQLCTKGTGEVLLDGEKYPFAKGDIVVVNSNVIHYTHTKEWLEYSCLIIDTTFCRQVGIDYTNLYFSPHLKNKNIENLFDQLKEVYSSLHQPFRTAKLNALILQLLIEICINYSAEKSETQTSSRSFENVKTAIKFLRENFNRKLTLDEIAKNVYTDKYILSKQFKKITGQTIIEYLNRYRCQMTADFIESGAGVAEAAYQCGFENMSFFSKTFKKYMGKLPSKYKKH